MINLLLAAAVTVAVLLAALFVHLRVRNLGWLQISTESVAYDHECFGHILSWDRHVFSLHGNPLVLLSGEFHYWRLPDTARWRQVLQQYKAAGLNCIRIYFHWGFHSPAQDTYVFTGNRDIDFLLSLCEELQLFVLCAPGPYICAETQAGGIPIWLVAQRDVAIRHSVFSFYRSYDAKYSNYCQEWFRQICPVIAQHQVTTKAKGCVLAFQVENEAFETFKGVPMGLSDDMRVLCKTARDNGITVPLFTNDAWEEGSFIAYPETHTVFGKKHFGVDLYGFDKYVVFCPTSAPLATITVGGADKDKWGDWDTKNVTDALSNTEKTIRSFGGMAAESPIFIPELQGGWFNHYTVKHTYDDVYNYYGEDYTRMIFDSCLSQGVSAMSFYMFYGGTNWGTLGDPDVYTSYDYSACIREYGHLSGRARQLRLSMSFVKSFNFEISKTISETDSLINPLKIVSALDDFIAGKRIQVGPNPLHFLFLRNFNRTRQTSTTLTVNRGYNKESISVVCKLKYKKTFIAIANYRPKTGPKLLVSSIPIYVRTVLSNGEELWIVQCDDEINGQLAFYGDLSVSGSLDSVQSQDGDFTIVGFRKTTGFAYIKSSSTFSVLNIIALTGNDLLTLNPVFMSNHWTESLGKPDKKYPIAIFWGTYSTYFDPIAKKLLISQTDSTENTICITATENSFPSCNMEYNGMPFIKQITNEHPKIEFTPIKITLSAKRNMDFSSFNWKKLETNGRKTVPNFNTIDYCYTSGHAAYKIEFESSKSPSTFDLNMRHRCTVYLNGVLIGGNIVYSLGILRAGAKNGPDVGTWGGWHQYKLPSDLLIDGANTITFIVESFGLNRQPFALNDARNPRGILSGKFNGNITVSNWYISGVDVRGLDNAYNHSGFDDQNIDLIDLPQVLSSARLILDVGLPCWYQAEFDYVQPFQLRLCCSGTATAYVFLNNVLMVRFYGNGDGPLNDFLLPSGILESKNKLLILTYTQCADSQLVMELKPWIVDGGKSLLGSGNIKEEGTVFQLYERIIDFK